MPAVRPGTTHHNAVVVHVAPPGDAVTVYEDTAAPPFDDGADHVTKACPAPALADAAPGAEGAVAATPIVTVAVATPEVAPVPVTV